jgi:hypothetical protein
VLILCVTVEAYFNDGRVVISSAVIGGKFSDNATGASIFHQQAGSTGAVVVVDEVEVWSVKSIWITEEEVLATPPPARTQSQLSSPQLVRDADSI